VAPAAASPAPSQRREQRSRPNFSDGIGGANHAGNGAASPARDTRRDPGRQADRDAHRNRTRAAKQRAALEAEIEKKETERGTLAGEMNDPNFYLARKDANEMIARYNLLGRDIDRLYEELVNFDQADGGQ